MKTVRVRTSKEYNVLIDAGLIDRAGEYIYNAAGGDIAAIITDSTVAGLYLPRLRQSLIQSGYKVAVFTTKSGESSKNIFTYSRVMEFLSESRVTRSDVIVAFGGGVVGDIAGFAAATYMHGIPYVQIPTTLLAAVDSSIGGKTGLDLDAGKDLTGVFFQPKVVLCDLSIIEKLPPRVFVEGCAEVIKYGIIADAELFHMLESGTGLNLKEVIARCVGIKGDIISGDEFENSSSRVLDFGHTMGHAIELLSKYNISHGKAVAIGMSIETLAAVRLGMCADNCYDELVDLLHKYGLPIRTRYEPDELMRAALTDKKRRGHMMTMVFPRRIGTCILSSVDIGKYESTIKGRSSAIGEML